LDPRPTGSVGSVSGSLLESRPHRAAHPDRPSCGAFRTTVEPAGTANRTSRDQRGKRTGFWHTVQFSRCERRPEGRTPRNGVARPTMVGTYAWGVNRGPSRGPGRQPPGTTIAGGHPGEGPLPSIGTPKDPQLPDLAGPSRAGVGSSTGAARPHATSRRERRPAPPHIGCPTTSASAREASRWS